MRLRNAKLTVPSWDLSTSTGHAICLLTTGVHSEERYEVDPLSRFKLPSKAIRERYVDMSSIECGFATVDTAIRLVQKICVVAISAQRDWKSAYGQICVQVDDLMLCGFSSAGKKFAPHARFLSRKRLRQRAGDTAVCLSRSYEISSG